MRPQNILTAIVAGDRDIEVPIGVEVRHADLHCVVLRFLLLTCLPVVVQTQSTETGLLCDFVDELTRRGTRHLRFQVPARDDPSGGNIVFIAELTIHVVPRLVRNRSVVGRPAEYRQQQLQTPVVRFLCTANCQDTQFDLPDFVKILQSIQQMRDQFTRVNSRRVGRIRRAGSDPLIPPEMF